MQTARVFIHGSGRSGAEAWPAQAGADGRFLSFDAGSSIAEQVAELAEIPSGAVVYAHSIGAVPAALAAALMHARGLVFVEPALYDIARGESVIERHIGIVTEARAQADAGDLRAFWGILRPLMFGGPLEPTAWERERPAAERWATTNLPWGHGVRAGLLAGIPTLVVTGGWNAEYELIAGILSAHGAEHHVLAGAQHRPQDLPGFPTLAASFEASLTD